MSHNFSHFLNELEVFFLFTYPRYQNIMDNPTYRNWIEKENTKNYEAVKRTKMRRLDSSIDSASLRYHGQGSQEI